MAKRKRYGSRRWIITAVSIAAFALVAALIARGVSRTAGSSSREGLAVAERAVRQAAVSCYALEGAYPATYEDLKARSGVAVDEDKYVVFYEIFASNIMPEITVIEREAMP